MPHKGNNDRCGQVLGTVKSRMSFDHIHVENPLDHPPKKYADVITQEEWTTFLKWWISDEAMKLRRRNINNQKEAQYPHHIRCAGYIGIELAVVRVDSFLFEFYIFNRINFHSN